MALQYLIDEFRKRIIELHSHSNFKKKVPGVGNSMFSSRNLTGAGRGNSPNENTRRRHENGPRPGGDAIYLFNSYLITSGPGDEFVRKSRGSLFPIRRPSMTNGHEADNRSTYTRCSASVTETCSPDTV
jgi:hypothetical protein